MSKSDTTTVTFRRQITTVRHGVIAAGQSIDLPTDEADRYVRHGIAAKGSKAPAAPDPVVEAVQPDDELDDDETPKRRTTTKRTAKADS